MAGHLIHLSVKEFQLLATLATEPARVFSKRELLETVWDFRSPGRTRTLDSHASRLRQKLGEHSGRRLDRQRLGRRLPAPPPGVMRPPAPELRPAATSAGNRRRRRCVLRGPADRRTLGAVAGGAGWIAAGVLAALHHEGASPGVANDVATLGPSALPAGELRRPGGGRVRRVELRSLADSVNGLAARLAREGHSRANFIGKVSHELRTPLTVIKGLRLRAAPGRG